MRIGSFIRASRHSQSTRTRTRHSQRVDNQSAFQKPPSFRDSTESFFSRHRRSTSSDENEGLWSDLGVLHIQRGLLISLAARENEMNGFQTSCDGFRLRSSWRFSSEQNQTEQHSRAERLEAIRRNVSEMLLMLHFRKRPNGPSSPYQAEGEWSCAEAPMISVDRDGNTSSMI